MSDKAAIIKEAQKYLARGQIDKAIAEWEKLAKESPDGNTFNTIGDLCLKRGDKTAAVDYFHKAARQFRDEGFSLKALALYKKILNIETSNTDALYALGELSEEKGLSTDAIKYYLASADILSKSGKKDALLKTYDRILNLSPSNISLRNKVADLFLKEGLQTEAAKEYLHIATLYDDKDDIANAKTYFKKALDLHPNNKAALLGMSSIYEKINDIRQASEYMKKAASIFPEDNELSLKCAQFLIRQESFAEAMPFVSRVVESEPTNIGAKKLLAEIHLKEGDKQKAWEEYSKVIDEMIFEEKIDDAINTLSLFKDVEPIETRKKLIPLYKQRGDFEAALTELVFLGDAFVLSEAGMLKEALECFREALGIHPDDASIKEKVTDLERELGKEFVTAQPEKSVEESLTEADIFFRYGLYDEAKNLLESLKVRVPENIEVHLKLKSLYTDTGDKEQAISECLVLAELYSRAGDLEQRESIIKEAYEINPEDPRLLELTSKQPSAESVSVSSISEQAAPTLNIEDYGEEIAEAEFYLRQELYEDARIIYEKLLKLFPDNVDIQQKLSQISEGETPKEELIEQPIEEKFELPAEEAEKKEEEFVTIEMPAEEPVSLEAVEAPEAPEPTLENEVLDIFEEFKKGLEKELGAEDSETHYNLGIAYKEMGLIDDAIKEFQTSKNDPQRFTQSINMLGICYMSKGLFPLAIDAFKSALDKISARDESYWGVKYDLAEAYEKNENLKEALNLCTEVYGWNSKFRNVAEKINMLKVMVAKEPGKPPVSAQPKTKKERVSYL